MPRPGPRPYECVRRAWHSDRHRPMRGSIIQQIFRVVTEAHSSVTKKNMEWQKKLPTVVLKAEEILYSKANSEAEYMNFDTLWDRVNDAINTIIRRDESTETGDLLPPCVEAALNLGCTIVRASRSQRHNNPRTYLNPRSQEPPCAPSVILDTSTNERYSQFSPLDSAKQLNHTRGTISANSSHLVAEPNRHATETSNFTGHRAYPLLYENIPQGHNLLIIRNEGNTHLNMGSVYPLYYGAKYEIEQPAQLRSQIPEHTSAKPIFVGTPVGPSIVNHAEMSVLQNPFSCPVRGGIVSQAIVQANSRDINMEPIEEECDLSLRLGLSLDPCMRVEKGCAPETEDVGSNSVDRGRVGALHLRRNKEFCFFPAKTADDPFDSCQGSGMFSGCGGYNFEANARKRKTVFGDSSEGGQFFRQQEPTSNHFMSGVKRPGL